MRLRFASLVTVYLISLCFGGLGNVFAADLVLEVISLRYRTVEQVLPVLQPLVPTPGTISGMQNRLIVRTTASNLSEIRRVLDAIDRQPRKLLITVRQDADSQRESGGFSGATGGAMAGGRTEQRVYSTQTMDNDRSTQQVQVLEGNEAFIRIGRSVPVFDRRGVWDGVGGRAVERGVDAIDYRDILTGFHARPRVAGEIVTVEISPQRDTPARGPSGSMNVQQLSTTVSGRLGEWIELGGVVTGRAFEATGTTNRTDAARTDHRRILLRVEEIP